MGEVISSCNQCNQKKLSGKQLSRGYPIPEQLISEVKVCFKCFIIVPFNIFIIRLQTNIHICLLQNILRKQQN